MSVVLVLPHPLSINSEINSCFEEDVSLQAADGGRYIDRTMFLESQNSVFSSFLPICSRFLVLPAVFPRDKHGYAVMEERNHLKPCRSGAVERSSSL